MALFSPDRTAFASPSSGCREKTFGRLVAALILLVPSSQGAYAASAHEAEIKLFATTMAIARTARETCPGVAFDDRVLEGIRQDLHVVEGDHPAFAAEAHAFVGVLQGAIAAAPSRQAWCDSVFRLYGPNGTMIRGMLRR